MSSGRRAASLAVPPVGVGPGSRKLRRTAGLARDHGGMSYTRCKRAASLATALLAGCHAPPIERATATAVLDAHGARWNQGDLEGFVATYWNGPELTFYGKGGLTRGRKDLLATYQRSYPTAKERGLLSFEVVEFAPLGTAHALVLGRYRIVGEAPSEGVFSLVLGVQNGAVVILHDHTTGTALK